MRLKVIYGGIIGLLILLSGIMYLKTDQGPQVSLDVTSTSEAEARIMTEAQLPTIVVYVTGEVASPDVYTVPEHSRLYEVIEIAGGFTPEATKEALNLARFVFDGERIYVPNAELIPSAGDSGLRQVTKVSINQGSEDELMTLTGIGATKAQAIIEYRESNGPFQKIEDIMKVNGIKDAMYNKIKDDIVI